MQKVHARCKLLSKIFDLNAFEFKTFVACINHSFFATHFGIFLFKNTKVFDEFRIECFLGLYFKGNQGPSRSGYF